MNYEKAEKAKQLFKSGYNCSQSVLGVWTDELNLDFSTAMKISQSFGGGMGRMREVCGAVSGMAFVAGVLYGYDDPKDDIAKKEHYERVQYLASEFKKETGSIICRELLGIEGKDHAATPSKRTQEYYKKRPCVKMVGLAAGILEQYMKKE